MTPSAVSRFTVCAEVLSLPLHTGLSDDDVARVIREVTGWVG